MSVIARMTTMTMLMLLLTGMSGGATEVSVLQQLSPPDLVVMPSGRVFVRQQAELQLPAGESELALQLAAEDAPDASVRLRVLSPLSGVEVSESHRRPDMPQRVWWTLRSAAGQPAVVQVRYQPAGLSLAVSYQAHLRAAEGLMDLSAKVTVRTDEIAETHLAHVLLPTGDRVQTRLEPGVASSQEFIAVDGIACELRHVYDERTHGKQVMRLVEFTAPDRGKPLPEGSVTFVTTQAGALRTLGSAVIPYGIPGGRMELRVCPVPEVTVTGGLTTSRQESVKQDVFRRLALYDLREEYEYRLLNRGSQVVELLFRYRQDGHWDVEDSPLPHTRLDAATAEWTLSLLPGQETTLRFAILNRSLTP